MKNLAKLFFDINRVSFLLIVLPFVTFNSFTLLNSQFFNYFNLFFLLFSILCIDFLSKIFLEWLKAYIICSILFLSGIVTFFYGLYFTTFFQEIFLDSFEILLRGRFILLFFLFLIIGIQLKIKKLNYIKFINFFLFIFTIINLLINIRKFNNPKYDLDLFSSNLYQIDLVDKSKKPVVLIITDEYSSPDELFGLFNDSSLYNFSKYLKDNNWLVRNSSISDETSTIHSISSLFNFNLSKRTNYSEIDKFDVGSGKLLKSSLYDSLNSKKIKFINFSIFKIGNSNPIYNLYNYPENFLQLFLINTVYNQMFYKNGGLKLEGFAENYFPMDDHNKLIFNSFPDSLNNVYRNNSFSYVHLCMPHSPYLFKEEFEYPLSRDINGYLEYWKFTNKKLEVFLNELSKSNKYRIILSGDHGFRADSGINPKNTFTAFYGFSEEDLLLIKSVQDLGSLINSCY
jgi:hypothetical protein